MSLKLPLIGSLLITPGLIPVTYSICTLNSTKNITPKVEQNQASIPGSKAVSQGGVSGNEQASSG